jgi:hypothetical protein
MPFSLDRNFNPEKYKSSKFTRNVPFGEFLRFFESDVYDQFSVALLPSVVGEL